MICNLFLILPANGNVQDKKTYDVVDKQHPPLNRDSLEQFLKTEITDSTRAVTLGRIALFIYEDEPVVALNYAQQAFDLCAKINYSQGEAVMLIVLGKIYIKLGQYDKALYSCLRTLREYDKRYAASEGKLKIIRAEILTDIGIIYTHLKQYKKAESCYKEAIKEARKFAKASDGESTLEGNILISMGSIYSNMERYDSAIVYYEYALSYGKRHKNDKIISAALINLAVSHNELGRYKEALTYSKQMLEVNKYLSNKRHDIYAHTVMGEIYLKANDLKNAEKYLLASLDMGHEMAEKQIILEIYSNLTKLYEAKKQYETALQYQRAAYKLHDSIYNDNLTNQLAEMQIKYETEKKDKQIQLLDKDKQFAEAQTHAQRVNRNFFIAAFIFILIISVVLASNLFLRKKVARALSEKNMELEEKNEELKEKNNLLNHNNNLLSEMNTRIEQQKKHIETINRQISKYNQQLLNDNVSAKYEILKSKINPHFLFNSFSTLSSIIMEEDRNTALEFVERFSTLYRAILETGETKLISLEKELQLVNNYLYLQQMKFGTNLIININVPESLYAYLIPPFALQMIVENATKHNIITSRRKLSISISAEDEMLIVTNNLQKKIIKPASTATGQQSIKERYKLVSESEPLFIELTDLYIAKIPLLGESKYAMA